MWRCFTGLVATLKRILSVYFVILSAAEGSQPACRRPSLGSTPFAVLRATGIVLSHDARACLRLQVLTNHLSQGFNVRWIIIQAGNVVKGLTASLNKQLTGFHVDFFNSLQAVR